MVLIKGEILNMTGMASVATSEKWKAPLIRAHFPNESKQIILLKKSLFNLINCVKQTRSFPG